MNPPVVSIRLAEDAGVTVERGEGIDDATWLQVRAFWNSDGRDAARRIVVPVESFLGERAAFARRLQALGVGATLDVGILQLAQRAKEDQQRLREVLDSPAGPSPAELEALLHKSRFQGVMRKFQTDDLAKLLSIPHNNGANFSVPGAGKTAVTLAVYEVERQRGRVQRLLVIAPLSAFGSWIDESDRWLDGGPEPRRYQGGKVPADAEILLVNYQRLASNYEALAAWVSAAPTMVVLDEAHRMKRGWSGEWGAACLSLAYRAARRDILTGTPAPQSPRDLIALIDFLWPNQAVRVLPPDALASNPPDDAMPRVAKAIAPLFVRTTKDDLDLPPITMTSVEVPLADLHAQIYDAIRDQYAGQFALSRRDRLDFLRLRSAVMYLLEAATNPKLLTAGSLEGSDPDIFRHPPLDIPPDSRLADLLSQYNKYETPTKFVELAKLLKANADQGRKTLVWSNFVRNLKLLQLQLARLNPALIHGGVPAYSPNEAVVTRETEIYRFRNDDNCLVLLANPAAMSEGISLHQKCHDAIYLERTFNAGQYLQSLDRIHRLGLADDQETRVTFLISQGTVDETVDQRIRIKAKRMSEMLNDPGLVSMALPNEEDYGPPIDDEGDAVALFAHLRGDDGP